MTCSQGLQSDHLPGRGCWDAKGQGHSSLSPAEVAARPRLTVSSGGGGVASKGFRAVVRASSLAHTTGPLGDLEQVTEPLCSVSSSVKQGVCKDRVESSVYRVQKNATHRSQYITDAAVSVITVAIVGPCSSLGPQDRRWPRWSPTFRMGVWPLETLSHGTAPHRSCVFR